MVGWGCFAKKMVPQKNLIIFLVSVAGYLWLVKPFISGELQGTFQAKTVPAQYWQFKNFIADQPGFFRLFWIPKRSRFGFWSNNHPAVEAEKYFTESQCQEPFCALVVDMPEKWGQACFPNDRCYVKELAYFLNPQTAESLRRMAVKYVVVPDDTLGEIFIAERQYDPQQRQKVEQFLDTIGWLKKVAVAQNITVYELAGYKNHFFIEGDQRAQLSWQKITPTRYQVDIKQAEVPLDLIFSETFHPRWRAKVGQMAVASQATRDNLNQFAFGQTGSFSVRIEFAD